MHRKPYFCAFVLLSSPAWATDWIVDASGRTSNLVNLTQAMAVVAPGDRVLVQPGNYPTFHFSRGVEVIGLGTDPSQVVIQSVGFHPTVPTLGWDTALVNLTICGGGGWGGNELASGTLVVDGVVTCGGVFLHGAGELYTLIINSSIVTSPGEGFLDASLDFAGGTLDVVNSRILGAPALSGSYFAGVALRGGAGSIVRLSDSQVLGGTGDPLGAGAFQNGGKAIVKSGGSSLLKLRLSGGTKVRGGAAAGTGAGGAAIDVLGAITLGTATVNGGLGSPAGASFLSSQPSILGYDPYLQARPGGRDGRSMPFVEVGQMTHLLASPSLGPTWTLGYSFQIDPPPSPMSSPVFAGGNMQYLAPPGALQLSFRIPRGAFNVPLRRIYYQAIFIDPDTGNEVSTNPAVMTIAP